jgi:hypothetical protein
MSQALRVFDVDAPIQTLEDPVAQWLDWEAQANLVGFRTSTQPVQVDVVSVPAEALEIHVLPAAPAEIVGRFLRGDRVLFARHPLNRDASVAWYDAPVAERWSARFTSSRTLAMPGPESGAALFSLKLATDHPHPDFLQPEKTRLREEALGAVEWADLIARVDAALGPPRSCALIGEVLVALVRDAESGFLVRDLRLFQDGHHYLPALSVPWVGRQIARLHGEPFDAFWARHFAERVGRTKAELLARYGLWFETPNPQNVVIQLDRRLRPTGRLVVRDLGDGECATDAMESKQLPWSRLTAELRPETQNSFWAFGDAGSHAVDAATLELWYARHDAGYFGELARWFPGIAPELELAGERLLAWWNETLRSPRAALEVTGRFRAAMRRRRTQA